MTGQQLKNSILQLAIEGKLVPQDPNDEPASVLLQRIREDKQRLVKEGKLKKKDLTSTPITDEEKPFDIPETWEWVRLEDILEFVNGRAYKKEELLPRGKYKVLRVGNFFTNESWYYSDLDLEDSKYCYKGDLLYAWSASFGPYIWEGDKTIFHYHIWNVRYSKENLYREYLYYFFLNDVNIIRKSTTGSTMVHVSMENMKPRLIPLPPLAEQRRIVARIDELMPLVEAYGKAQEELEALNAGLPEALKKSILQEAIQGRLVPQNANDEPASVLLARIRKEKEQLVKAGKLKKKDLTTTPITEEDKPFDIPESWEWCRLGEISTYASTKKKINAAVADPTLWGLDLEDIQRGGSLLVRKTVGERKAIGDKTCFDRDDILYSKLRPYLLKILLAPEEGICTPEIVPFKCFGSIFHKYIIAFLKSPFVDDYINTATFGVKMPRVGTDTMTSLVVPLPPLAEQHRIVAKIEEVFAILQAK